MQQEYVEAAMLMLFFALVNILFLCLCSVAIEKASDIEEPKKRIKYTYIYVRTTTTDTALQILRESIVKLKSHLLALYFCPTVKETAPSLKYSK